MTVDRTRTGVTDVPGTAGPARSTVVGVFDDRRRAEEAIAELERIGFGPDEIGFAVRDHAAGAGRVYQRREGDGGGTIASDTGAGTGMLTGAATGGVLGGVIAAAAALAVPGVGPAIAAGILGPVLGSAAAGAAVGAAGGGLLGGLVTTGVSEDEARYYDQEFRSGRAIVTVKAGDRATEAQRILRDFGGYDSETRGSDVPSANVRGASASPGAVHAMGPGERGHGVEVPDRGAMRVPAVDERLDVQKRESQLGEVRVHQTVETEQKTVPVDLQREEVHVERRDVQARPLASGDTVGAFEEGTIRVPVRGEEAVVRKEPVVTGEVVIHKERTVEREEVTDTVRRQHVEVDEDYNRHRDSLKQHFDTANTNANRLWEEAEPNYRSGWRAGRDQRWQGRAFEDVEPDLRSSMGHDDDRWQQLREEIHEGFQRARR